MHPLPATDLPKVPPHMIALDPKSANLSDLVTHFSAIYQHYQLTAANLKQSNSSVTNNNSSKMELQWAEYYMDLSTRAAHHYNDLLNKQREELQQQQQQQQRQQQLKQPQAPPLSFQQYAHRNLRRCTDNTQKTAMTELIQLTIQKSIRDRTMHTKQWDYEPLLPLPSSSNENRPSSSHSLSKLSTHSFSSQNSNANSNANSKDGKSKSSYLDALTGANNNDNSIGSRSHKRKASTINTAEIMTTGNQYENDHKKSRFSNNKGSSTHGLSQSSYDDSLPVNDSYYGSSSSSPLSKNKKIQQVQSSNSTRSNNNEPEYDEMLPDNDSYYGRPSTMTNKKSTKSTKHKNNNSNTDFEMGDYISLSSLSTEKYIKKNKKLVKLPSTSTSTSSTKKKSIFLGSENETIMTSSKLESRLNRFSGHGGIAHATSNDLHLEYKQNIDKYMGKTIISNSHFKKKNYQKNNGKVVAEVVQLDEYDYEQMTVKGTCQVLEKEYLRLTAPPRAELVRPQHILKQHLMNLKQLWKDKDKNKKNDNNNKCDNYNNEMKNNTSSLLSSSTNNNSKDYNWFCSQLKAIRQDLTVQRIFNDFAIDVYETHAKIALQEGDLNEYNQSQTQLKELYEILSVGDDNDGLRNQNEFIAYRIIYYVFLTGNKKYDGGSSDLLNIMLNLSCEQRVDVHIAHALQIRVAVADNDYHSFFRLRGSCPNMGSCYLMDLMIGQIRASGLHCMVRAYRPSLSVEFIVKELGFGVNMSRSINNSHSSSTRKNVDNNSHNSDGGGNKSNNEESDIDIGNHTDIITIAIDEGLKWLKHCGCKLSEDEKLVVTKDTILNESNLIERKVSSLI